MRHQSSSHVRRRVIEVSSVIGLSGFSFSRFKKYIYYCYFSASLQQLRPDLKPTSLQCKTTTAGGGSGSWGGFMWRHAELIIVSLTLSNKPFHNIQTADRAVRSSGSGRVGSSFALGALFPPPLPPSSSTITNNLDEANYLDLISHNVSFPIDWCVVS